MGDIKTHTLSTQPTAKSKFKYILLVNCRNTWAGVFDKKTINTRIESNRFFVLSFCYPIDGIVNKVDKYWIYSRSKSNYTLVIKTFSEINNNLLFF